MQSSQTSTRQSSHSPVLSPFSSRINPEIPEQIVVDEEKIGYAMSRILLIHDYYGKNRCHSYIEEEIITLIYFKYCKTIGDILKSFKT